MNSVTTSSGGYDVGILNNSQVGSNTGFFNGGVGSWHGHRQHGPIQCGLLQQGRLTLIGAYNAGPENYTYEISGFYNSTSNMPGVNYFNDSGFGNSGSMSSGEWRGYWAVGFLRPVAMNPEWPPVVSGAGATCRDG